MSHVNKEIQKAVILRLKGVLLEDILALPEIERLVAKGIKLELEPSLIAEPQNQEYQALTGRYPASFGFFDTLIPACHLPRTGQSPYDYSVIEEHAGRDTTPALLPDLLHKAGWDVQQATFSLTELSTTVQRLLDNPAHETSCLFLNCIVETKAQFTKYVSVFQEAMQVLQSWVGETGLFAVLSEIQPTHVKRFVNMNNFLADMGILEREEQTNSIHWADSLAYFAGSGQLWVNLSGREPEGAVSLQDEYEEVRDTLVKALPAKLRDPETGETVIERIYRKEELYKGDFLFCAPDLIVMFKPGYASSPRSAFIHFDEATFSTPASDESVIAGTHPSSLKGFLLASSPAFATGVEASGQLVAIVPTLLHALGIAYTGLESFPLQEAFSYAYLSSHPVADGEQSHDLSEEDEELVINRLRDLGYI